MPVRKTESRLPAATTVSELGQSATVNTNIHMVSFLSSPIAKQRLQTYFVFVTDAAIAATVATYDWTITDGVIIKKLITADGTTEYTPQTTGTLTVSVQLKNTVPAVIATVSLSQTVVELNAALEVLVDQQDEKIPSAAHPATSREVINDLRMYADPLLPPAANDLFNKMLLSTGYAAAMATPQVERNFQLESYAKLLNTGRHADFLSATEKGIGICKVRPQVLAMFLNKTNLTELPAGGATIKTVQAAIASGFNALTENDKIDLFNLIRFPKSSYKMAKLIYEKLKDKYFTSSTIPQILGVEANAQKLVQQYEAGPMAIAGVAKVSTFAAAVVKIMQQQVWNIKILPIAGSAPAAGGAVTPPAFGSPEHIPDITFIAEAAKDDNGFIRQAFWYHDTYGLQPETVDSFEDLVEKLVKANKPVKRMRLVSHFYLGSLGQWASCLNMPFFKPPQPVPPGQENHRYTIGGLFRFAISDDAGFATVIQDKAPWLNLSRSTIKINDKEDTLANHILKEIRKSQPGVLIPFNLQGANSTPPKLLNDFIHLCCSLWLLNNVVKLNWVDRLDPPPIIKKEMGTLTKAAFKKYYTDKIDAAAPGLKTATIDDQKISDLQSAIEGTSFGFSIDDYNIQVHPEFLNNHDDFRTKVKTIAGLFSANSVIDVRGCNIGSDMDFMNAMKEFFGKTGAQPKVTAPEWFQKFGFHNIIPNLITNEGAVDKMFNNGYSTYTSTDVQREYANWGGRLGIPSHISFWKGLSGSDPFDFLAYQWKNNLPGLALPATKLTGFAALTFPDALSLLGEIFNIAASVPAAGVLTSFTNDVLPHLAGLKTVADNVAAMTASTLAVDLDTANTAVQQAKTNLEQTLPPAPVPMTLQYLKDSIETLKSYVKTKLDIAPFLKAMDDKLKAPTAGIRYTMFIGLAIPVQKASKEVDILLMMLDGLRDQALKSWIQGQWVEPAPAAATLAAMNIVWSPFSLILDNGTPTNKNDDQLTSIGKFVQVAQLAFDQKDSIIASNPAYEYQEHIISTT